MVLLSTGMYVIILTVLAVTAAEDSLRSPQDVRRNPVYAKIPWTGAHFLFLGQEDDLRTYRLDRPSTTDYFYSEDDQQSPPSVTRIATESVSMGIPSYAKGKGTRVLSPVVKTAFRDYQYREDHEYSDYYDHYGHDNYDDDSDDDDDEEEDKKRKKKKKLTKFEKLEKLWDKIENKIYDKYLHIKTKTPPKPPKWAREPAPPIELPPWHSVLN